MSKLVVITIEGLAAELLGCYGSNTAVTQSIDRLAADGWVFDSLYLDGLDLERQLISLWTGQHQFERSEFEVTDLVQSEVQAERSGDSLWERTTESMLLTDDETVAEHAEKFGCSEVSLISAGENDAAEVADADQAEATSITKVTELFLASADELSGTPNDLVWIHSKGLTHPWDAPQDLRNKFKDIEDPDPPGEILVPSFAVDGDTDPDLVLGWMQVAAAQAALIDDAVGLLTEVIASRPDSAKWNVLLVTLGGIPLGAHGHFGAGKKQLNGTELQCGGILRFGGTNKEFGRVADTVQINHLGRLLNTLLQSSTVNSPEELVRDSTRSYPVLARSEDNTWIRVPAWSARIPSEPGKNPALFVQPDDRWEVSDVASLIPHIAEALSDLCTTSETAYRDKQPLPEIASDLTSTMR